MLHYNRAWSTFKGVSLPWVTQVVNQRGEFGPSDWRRQIPTSKHLPLAISRDWVCTKQSHGLDSSFGLWFVKDRVFSEHGSPNITGRLIDHDSVQSLSVAV
jgi:hypothetical protein